MDKTIRQRYELFEQQTLAPGASLAIHSRGRERPEPPDEVRTVYQRDRDRILHSQSFRRLMYKTQVFLSPAGDDYRTRLTHTLEVNQIARTVARALRLNEDLTEAIALGHDVGHTPFGHTGEQVLNSLYSKGFLHSQQSLRVVETLEKDGQGLNLTWEVRDGILNHSANGNPSTLEGQLVHIADRIAYVNHDIEDAIRAGVLQSKDLPTSVRHVLGDTKSERINTLVSSLITNSKERIQLSEEHQRELTTIREFLFEAVYRNPVVTAQGEKAQTVIEHLYFYYLKHPEQLPRRYQTIVEAEGAERAICDYLSSMTDRFCISKYEELFIPKSWSVL